MKWNKLGKIFNTGDYLINNHKIDYSQSPQVLIMDSHLRVYFSTRRKDSKGKFISEIAFVDFTKDFLSIIRVSNQDVLNRANVGCYDEHGVFPLNIVKKENEILGYIGGWSRRASVMIDGSIGLAISKDKGDTFTRIADGPIMSSCLNEPFLVADPFVQVINSKYYMWYIFGQKWIRCNKTDRAERIYKIACATSNDGVNWERDNQFIIDEILNEEECQALPSVIEVDGVYHMYFCFRYATDFRNSKRGYRMGHAYSTDLISWTRNDDQMNISLSTNSDDWDSEMLCYPHVFKVKDQVYMLYNGNEFGRYGFGLAILEK